MSYFPSIKTRIWTVPLKRRRRQETPLRIVSAKPVNELACEFAAQQLSHHHRHNNSNNNADALAMQISLAKRHLIFSAAEFIRTWLDQLPEETPWALDAYYALVQRLPGVLTLARLVQLAERTWFLKQWRLLLQEPSGSDVAKEYLQAMILDSVQWIDQVCEEERRNIAHDRQRSFLDGLALQVVLETIHDPTKLLELPMEERYGIAMKLLEQGDDPGDGLHQIEDIMAVKSRLWNNLPTPVARQFALWFVNDPTDQLLAWIMDKPSRTRLLVFTAVCHVWADMSDLSQATSLIGHLNVRMQNTLDSNDFSLSVFAILLLLVQTAVLSFGDLIGMRYQKWFQHIFLDPNASCLNATINTKKSAGLFVSCLEAMVPGENPSVLQFHGKALSGKQLFPTRNYVSLVKTRLMEHGLDHSLRQYPSSLQIPLQLPQHEQQMEQQKHGNNPLTLTGNAVSHHVEDEIERILQEFEKTQLIPKDLWEDTIFRPRWFKATFLPAITLWPGDAHVRDALMTALKEKKRVNENIFNEYMGKRTP